MGFVYWYIRTIIIRQFSIWCKKYNAVFNVLLTLLVVQLFPIYILSKLGLNVKLEGVGYVVAQSIPEGSEFTPNQEIVLQLSPRYE